MADVASSQTTGIALLRGNSWLKEWWQGRCTWWWHTTRAMRLYVGGLVTVVLAVLVGRLFGVNPVTGGLLFAGALYLSLGFLVEAYDVGKRLWETAVGKLVGALMATMIAATSMGLSSALINEATGLDPTNLPYAVAFVAPMTAGYLLLAGCIALSGLSFVAFLIIELCLFVSSLLNLGKHRSPRNVDQQVLRALGAMMLLLFATTVWQLGKREYESALTFSSRWFTFGLEFYGRDSCAQPGERIRRLSDDVVAVGRLEGGGPRFSTRTCPITAPDSVPTSISPPTFGNHP